MAQNILGALGELGFRELGVKERPGLVVLRRTKMPALLIETGFINSEKDNQLFEKKFEEIARSIADAILGTLNEEGGRAIVLSGTDRSISKSGKCRQDVVSADRSGISGVYPERE